MGNCKSCVKPKTSDDLDRQSEGRQSTRQQGQSTEAAGNGENSHSLSSSQQGSSRTSVKSRTSSSKSRKSLKEAVQPATYAENKDNVSKENAEENSDLKRSSSSRASRKILSAGSTRNKENIANVIKVRPVDRDVYMDGGKNLMNELSTKYRTQNFADICSILWKEDERFTWNKDYKFSRNRGLECYIGKTLSPTPRTYDIFKKLLESYSRGDNSNIRKRIEDEFLDAVMTKRVMQICWAYLNAANYCSYDRNDFRNVLSSIWFPRAFEHIFAGLADGDGVSGLHNWLQYSIEQQKGNIDYISCIKQIPGMMVCIKFSWNGELKEFGSMFIGTSPEFEMALYTLLYFQSCKQSLEENTYDLVFEQGHDKTDIMVKVILRRQDKSLKTAYPVRPRAQ